MKISKRLGSLLLSLCLCLSFGVCSVINASAATTYKGLFSTGFSVEGLADATVSNMYLRAHGPTFGTWQINVSSGKAYAFLFQFFFEGNTNFLANLDYKNNNRVTWRFSTWASFASSFNANNVYININDSYNSDYAIRPSRIVDDAGYRSFYFDFVLPDYVSNIDYISVYVPFNISQSSFAIETFEFAVTSTGPTDDIIDNQDKNTSQIIGNQDKNTSQIIGNQDKNTSKITDNQDKNTDKIIDNQNKNHEETKGLFATLFAKLGDWFMGLLNGILDGLKNLFIPSEEYMTSFFADLNTFLEEHLGFLYYPIACFVNIFQGILAINPNASPSITLPALVVPVGTESYTIWEQQAYAFDFLQNEPFKTIHNYYLMAVDALIAFSLVGLFKRKMDEMMSG